MVDEPARLVMEDKRLEASSTLSLADELSLADGRSRLARRSRKPGGSKPLLLAKGFLLAALALSFTSCGSVPPRVEVPEEGTIVLHSPAPAARSSTGFKLNDTTIIFTTATEDLEGEPDRGLEVTVGTRAADVLRVRTLDEIQKGTSKPTARVLDAEGFATLWRSVDAAGLFKLPRHPGGRPPESGAYILVKTRDGQQIYTRPRPPSSPEDQESAKRLLEYWRNSKVAIVMFLNG